MSPTYWIGRHANTRVGDSRLGPALAMITAAVPSVGSSAV